MRVFLIVYGRAGEAPTTAAERDRYCTFVRSALARYPSVNDAVIWIEPNLAYFWRPQFDTKGGSAAPAAYEALLARCWDVLHGLRPTIRVVGPSLSPAGSDDPKAKSNVSHSPGTFLRGLGSAYRRSGRGRPILDVVSHHVYGAANFERPWYHHVDSKWLGEGDWNKLMWNLALAFGGTAQPLPGECGPSGCVRIAYLESGFETTAPRAKAPLYRGRESAGPLPDLAPGRADPPAPDMTSRAPDQATQVLDALRLAYCQPYVDVLLNFLLRDEPDLGRWQSAAFWVDGTPKASLPAFRAAAQEASGHAVDCAALKGGAPSADYRPPSRPTALGYDLAPGPLRVRLSWEPSSDPSEIAGYRVYRNGGYLGWSATTTFDDATVVSGRGYSYTVVAQDRAWNVSEPSDRVVVYATDRQASSATGAFAKRGGASITARVRRRPLRVVLTWRRTAAKRFTLFRNGVAIATTRSRRFVDRRPRGKRVRYRLVAYGAAGDVHGTAAVTVRVRRRS